MARRERQRRPKGSGSIYYDRSKGLWYGEISERDHHGKRRTARTKGQDSRRDAGAALKQLLRRQATEGLAFQSSVTVAQYAQQWLSMKRATVKERTWQGYEQRLRTWVLPAVGHKKIKDLIPSDVTAIYADAIQRGNEGSIPQIKSALSAMLRAAVADEVAVRNVADRSLAPIPKRQVPPEVEPPTIDDVVRVAQVATRDRLAPRWLAMIILGLRSGEVLGLERSSLDLTPGSSSLTVNWQLQRIGPVHGCGTQLPDTSWPCGKPQARFCPKRIEPSTENREIRHIEASLYLTRPKSQTSRRKLPLPDVLAEMFRQYIADAPHLNGNDAPTEARNHDLLWRTEAGNILTPDWDSTLWGRLLEQAGVPPTKRHNIRHAAATILMRDGAPSEVSRRIMGHSKTHTTRIYEHAADDDLRAALDGMERRIHNGETCSRDVICATLSHPADHPSETQYRIMQE